MLVLIGVHALTALLAPTLHRALGRRVFGVLAPGLTFVDVLAAAHDLAVPPALARR